MTNKQFVYGNLLLDNKIIEISQVVKTLHYRPNFMNLVVIFIDLSRLISLHEYEYYLDIIIKLLLH